MRLEAWVVALIASLGGSELPLSKTAAGARAAMASRGLALEDECFIERKLYPNVDFYSGQIYQAKRVPVDMFPVLFANEEKVMLANSVKLRSESIEEGKNLR